MHKSLQHATHAHITKAAGGTWRTVKGALPDGALAHHLNGGPRYGVPFVRPGDGTAMAGMIDVDDHDGSAGWGLVSTTAAALMERAESMGVVLHPYRSGGGKGVNLWAVWEQPQQADAIKWALEWAVKACGLAVGARGVASGQVEVFPKQGSVAAGEVGNCAALPRTPLCSWSWGDVDAAEWVPSAPVSRQAERSEDRGLGGTGVESLTADQLRDLLRFVPVAGIGYDDWWARVMAIHDAGGSIELAREWSRYDPAYADDDGLTDAKWRSIRGSVRATRVTVRTLMKLAADAGWGGLVADVEQFPVAEVDGELLQDYARVPGKGRYAGYVESSVEQVSLCVAKDPEFPFRLSFDTFLQDKLISVDHSHAVRLVDAHYVLMRRWFDRRHWEPVTGTLMRDAAEGAVWGNRTNLAQEWAAGLRWDGVDRYDESLRRMGAQVSEYYRAVVRYQWTSHGARVLEPGYQADAIIVIVGEQQGTGKTQMINALAPRIGGVETYRNIGIDDLLHSDKSARAMKGCLVANLDEMRDFGRRESSEIKAALSKMRESYIPKYRETREEFGRACVIYATNNHSEFLDDETGNRRYHPIVVGKIDVEWFRTNAEQLWAQGVEDFRANGQAWRRALELAPEAILQHNTADDWQDAVRSYLETMPGDRVTGADILTNALGVTMDRIDMRAQKRVGKIMRELNWERAVIRDGAEVKRCYRKRGDNRKSVTS